MQTARCVAVLGTASDVGKSVVATGLCRLFKNGGFRVAPFKAQNMSNNSGVTPDGLEMGRAQIVQAEAAGIAPHIDMNPVLLKPTSQVGPQAVVMGKALDPATARLHLTGEADLFGLAAAALDRLRRRYDVVVLEGAGSCAEVNLMPRDLVNFRMAAHAGAPVILVGDIHRGGVFAQLVGTLACLSKRHRDQVAGFVINRFIGELELFGKGVEWIEKKTRKRVFGVLPWFNHITIESEDSVVIEKPAKAVPSQKSLPAVAVIRLPHISNFNDVTPLASLDGVEVFFLERLQRLDPFKAVILPGSKNTRHDLAWLFSTGCAEHIRSFAETGGHILGVCGGYQMLGRSVEDPDGIEGRPGITAGLGLLPVDTLMKAPKTTSLTRFVWGDVYGLGYEIHMGRTQGRDKIHFCSVLDRNGQPVSGFDGCVSNDGRVTGTYIHGLFDTPSVLQKWLGSIGLTHIPVPQIGGLQARNREYDLLAEHMRTFLDVDAIQRLVS